MKYSEGTHIFISVKKLINFLNSRFINFLANKYKEVIFMTINELIAIIGNVGFPVAVSAYLLIRLEKQLDSLSNSINKLNNIISAKIGMVIDNTNENIDSKKIL